MDRFLEGGHFESSTLFLCDGCYVSEHYINNIARNCKQVDLHSVIGEEKTE